MGNEYRIDAQGRIIMPSGAYSNPSLDVKAKISSGPLSIDQSGKVTVDASLASGGPVQLKTGISYDVEKQKFEKPSTAISAKTPTPVYLGVETDPMDKDYRGEWKPNFKIQAGAGYKKILGIEGEFEV